MFTDGLDQTAINWVYQGSEVGVEPRSPLTEKYECEAVPRSPLLCNTGGYVAPRKLPPLKFHSGLLGKHSLASLGLSDSEEHSDSIESDYDGEESVASAPYDMDGYYSDKYDQDFREVDSVDVFERRVSRGQEDEISGLHTSTNVNNRHVRPLINRGSSKMYLKVELPEVVRRLSDLGQSDQYKTPGSCFVTSQAHSMQGTPIHHNTFYDAVDLGTPSAPPMNTGGIEGHGLEDEGVEDATLNDMMEEQTENEVHVSSVGNVYSETRQASLEGQENIGLRDKYDAREKCTVSFEGVKATYCDSTSENLLPCYSASAQTAWQTLVAYDACVRLCLNAWAKGCPAAPEFLRDECLALRSSFGLNNFLLHPHGFKAVECRAAKSAEESCTVKRKKVAGKIRVEVKKLRIIPSRKLKSTYSQRGSFYLKAGSEYVRHVSSLVKSGINSLLSAPLSATCEEHFSCFILLKSSMEDSSMDYGSAVCLHSGSGDYHDFFPESQADALLIHVQDANQIKHGQAVIPFSLIAENLNDRVRWWPICNDEHECIGKIQLSLASSFTNDEQSNIKSNHIVETLAYDLLLEAAMRAHHFHSSNLRVDGSWKWLLSEFADYYGVSDSYTKLRYLSYVMDVATPTKDCINLVLELLMPITKARSERRLNRQEKSILMECETQIESLLANVFENYKSLDELSPKGLSDLLIPIPETAPPALAPAVQVYTLIHDILAQDAQTALQNYLQRGAQKRCRRHILETDEFMSTASETVLTDPVSISTAYLKMKNLCKILSSEILADIKIHNQHILPSSIDLSNITAAVYSTELSKRLKGFLVACPPSRPLPHVNELLAATSDFERDLESWSLSLVQGGVGCKELFHDYIMLWIEEMQLEFLDLCKAEKVPWSGITTNHSTSPFVENMYLKIKDALTQYEMVINRWPQYSLALEKAVADVERAIMKTLEKQYSETLAPLKESIPKKLGMQVQKLARRQTATLYIVPNQLGTFLNTVKRVIDVLHCKIEDILKSWASCLPVTGDNKKSSFGEHMNGITVLLRAKYKTYMQAIVAKLYSNMQASRSTQLRRILEETHDSDGEAEIRERMQKLISLLVDCISNLHEVCASQIFIALCRGFWDRIGQCVLRFSEGRKENPVWYKGTYYTLGIVDDTFASEMQRLQGNSLRDKDLDLPRSVAEARSILCRETTNGVDHSSYFNF